jgi:hypothetical protein
MLSRCIAYMIHYHLMCYRDIIDSLMEGSSNDQSNTSIYNVDDEQPFVYEGGGASSSGLYQITSTPVYPNSNISCTLKAPTASCTKNDETTVTYLNRGQPYVINISSNGPHISDYKVNEHQFNYHGLSMVFPVLFGKQYCWFSIP